MVPIPSKRLILFAASLTLTSCVSPAHRGRVVDIKSGTPFLDFTFIDEQDRSHTLGESLGDFTILTFTKCGADLHAPVSTKLGELVRVSQDAPHVRTVGFDIHRSDAGCQQSDNCHLLGKGNKRYSICDARGLVRRTYAADQRDPVFVIGPRRQIVERGSLDQFDDFQARFRQRFNAYAARQSQNRPKEDP